VFKLLGGQAHDRLPAYANGWYGGANSPKEYASKASEVVSAGYTALKFDPFGVAWLEMTRAEMSVAEERVAAVRKAVGDEVQLMIEVHGRFSASCAIEMGQRLIAYRPAWYEEPVTPHSLDLLHAVKQALPFPIAAGERLYMLEDFDRLTAMQACDIVQMDLAHCGGLAMGKKIAALATERGLRVSPHCSMGPVALCAAFILTGHKERQHKENFDYDVPWRHDFLHSWNPCRNGIHAVPTDPGAELTWIPAPHAAVLIRRTPSLAKIALLRTHKTQLQENA
jgi:galactonate dehydratase